MEQHYLRIGHRGYPAAAPENTMASFQRAIEAGVDAIELDVHLSKDNHFVVMHDGHAGRTVRPRASGERATANPPGTKPVLVRDLTLAQLREMSAGEWFAPEFSGEVSPTLDEVLELIRGRVRLFVELKAGSFVYPGVEEKLIACLKEHGVAHEVQVSSFDHHALLALKDLEPRLSTATLIACRPVRPVDVARAARADAIHPFYGFVTPDFVEEAHAAGLAVYTWTVDDKDDVKRLASWGVDGIMSNNAELFSCNQGGDGPS